MVFEELQEQLEQTVQLEKNQYFEESGKLASEVLEKINSILNTLETEDENFIEAKRLQARALLRVSSTYSRRGIMEHAYSYAQESLKIADEYNFHKIQLGIYKSIWLVHFERSEFQTALRYLKKALDINKNDAAVLHNIGMIYDSLSEYVTALEYFHKALLINEETQHIEWMTNNLIHIGIVFRNLEDNMRAIEYLSKALELAQKTGQQLVIAIVLTNIGMVYLNINNHPKALEYLSESLELTNAIGYQQYIASNLSKIGAVYHMLQDYTNALEYMLKGLSIYEELGLEAEVAENLGNIGLLYSDEKFEGYLPEKAEGYLLKAIEIYEEIGVRDFLYKNHNRIANLYENEKRWEEFAYHFKKYHEIEKEVFSEENKKYAEKFAQEREAAEQDKQLAVERARSQATDNILSNILPMNVMERLIKGEKKIADTHENVSVLFVDIVGFTNISSKLPADELIDLLDIVFTRFDSICKKHGLEKIKTIGDAYMAVCGAPIPCENHAERSASAALEMLGDFEIEQRFSVPVNLNFRIGLHSGSVVAGIIGENKYAYDLWGDAVNTASRMESHGEAGKIHTSEDFVRAIELHRDDEQQGIQFTLRGEMDIKGKGMMKTYFLEKAT